MEAYNEAVQDLIGFPHKYRFNHNAKYRVEPWDKSVKRYNYVKVYIYITPKLQTSFNFRDIFSDSTLTFRTAKEAKRWLDSPNLSYWTQQLNFAFFCATGGCGVTKRYAR